MRKCSSPPPSNGGRDCRSLGPSVESQDCNVKLCNGKSVKNEITCKILLCKKSKTASVGVLGILLKTS